MHEFDGDAKNCQCSSQGQGLDLQGQGHMYRVQGCKICPGGTSRTTSHSLLTKKMIISNFFFHSKKGCCFCLQSWLENCFYSSFWLMTANVLLMVVMMMFQLHFISPYVNSGTASPASGPMSVFAYIGTPPALRRQSRLLWRQGPCYLIEEVVAMPVIQTLYRLGPNYVGSLQAQGTHNTTAHQQFTICNVKCR